MGEGVVSVPESDTQGIEIVLGRKSAEPDAQSTINGSGIESHGLQHMTAGAFLTGGAFGDVDLTGFKEVHEDLAAPSRQRD